MTTSEEQHNLRWLVASLTWLALIVLLAGASGEPDVWGHVRFGVDILQTRSLAQVDPYSFTQDVRWVNHEWLSELFMGTAYWFGGVRGLLVLKLAVLLCAYWILWRAWQKANPLVAAGFMLLAAIGALTIVRTTRPQLWTLAGLLAVLAILHQPMTRLRVATLAVIFIAWVNLHGGFFLGLAVLSTWCAVAGLQEWRRSKSVPLMRIVCPLVCTGVTIVNPYGTDIWRFLWDTVGFERSIVEWWPLWMQGPKEWLPFAVLLAIVFALRLWPDWPATCVMLLMWYGGIRVARVAYLAVPVTILLIAPVVARRWPATTWHWRAPSAAAGRLMAIPLLAAMFAAWPLIRTPFECLPIGDQDPSGAARLVATHAEGRVATWFNWGQYALWHLSPRLKVSWDGRRETVYSEETQRTQRAVAMGSAAGDEWLRATKPEYVWLPSAFSTRRAWLGSNGYRIDHETNVSFIAVRSDLAALPQAPPLGQCFR